MIENLIYVDYFEDANKFTDVNFNEFPNNKFYLFTDNHLDFNFNNVSLLIAKNYNNFPKELSCLMQVLNVINKDCYYFLNFELATNIDLCASIDSIDDDFKFYGSEISDISTCLANYRDQVLFSSKNNNYLNHGFPLLIKGDKLQYILQFIKLFLDLNIFNYNIEGIFSILKNLKYG
jgi:hypothetical protein